MTFFKLLVDFAYSHLKLSQMDLSELWGVTVEDIKNWNRRGFPKRTTKPGFGVRDICETLFFDPGDNILRVYGSPERIMDEFIRYIQAYGYSIDHTETMTQSDFLLFMNTFLLADTKKKKQALLKADNRRSPYDSLFEMIKTVSAVSLPDYSTLTDTDTKRCTVSRATLISLARHCLGIDIDNELSEGCSVDELNRCIRDSSCPLLKEFAARGFGFAEWNTTVIVSVPECDPIDEPTDDTLLEILKTLHAAYLSYDIHARVSDVKKIELNCSIAVWANALSYRGVFNTVERKRYIHDFIRSMIQTHNHDCNYLYMILCGIKSEEQRAPLVELGADQTAELVGDYCLDVYLTDQNPLGFIPHFLKTLDHYRLNRGQKTGILERLLYEKKVYDLRLIEALAEIDKSHPITIQKHLETNVFSLAVDPLTPDSRRELIAFICMFGRSSFDGLIYFDSPNAALFQKSFSGVVNFVLRRLDQIVPRDHLRRRDVAHSLAGILLTMRKYDEEAARETFKNVKAEKFEAHKLLKDTYAFIVRNEISVLCASEYVKSFPTRDLLLSHIEEHLICTENPFLEGDNPLLQLALGHIRSAAAADREKVSPRLKSFADELLFWMIEATEADARQGKPLRYAYLLVKQYPGALQGARAKEYAIRRSELLVSIIQAGQFSLLDPHLLSSIWNLFRHDTKLAITGKLNECIAYVFSVERALEAVDFILSHYPFVEDDNQARIRTFVRELIGNPSALRRLSAQDIRALATFIIRPSIRDEMRAERYLLLLATPHLERLSVYEAFDIVCWKLLNKEASEEIARSLSCGETVYRELIDFLLGSRFRSWQRACLKNLLSALLQTDCFASLEEELQISLIHYVKDKGEYVGELKALMRDVSLRDAFEEMDPRLKTALTIHSHRYLDLDDPQNAPYLAFMESVLETLTRNAYTSTEIKSTYGLRTDTLIYHVLEFYRTAPEKTAILCISAICKIYKQLHRLASSDAWNPFKSRLLTDRVKLFKTVVANPCIKHIAHHYVGKMYRLINRADMDRIDSHLGTLRRLLVEIYKKDQWPNWFDVHPIDVCVRKEDTVRVEVPIDKASFLIGEDADRVPNDNARQELIAWRDRMEEAPLTPSDENEVVVMRVQEGYLPISGWSLVYECISSAQDNVEFSPTEIISTVVSIAEIESIRIGADQEEPDYERLVYLYGKLFEEIMALVPFKLKKKGWIKKGKEYAERIFVREDYGAIDKSISPKLITFLDFYYEHIYLTPNIRSYVLAPYYDYYKSVKREVLAKLENKPV